MNKKEKAAWEAIRKWLEEFNNDGTPWEKVPAADLLTLMWEAEQNKKAQTLALTS
jgi:hypothetical protein